MRLSHSRRHGGDPQGPPRISRDPKDPQKGFNGSTELSGAGNSKVHEGCHPSPSFLRESVAKGFTHKALTGKSLVKCVPVVGQDRKPLMPTSPKRVRQMVASRKATPFWDRGIFCVRLNQEPSARKTQPIAVGIDPGSKKEGFTVKSAQHTYLNIQADAVTWVKKHVEDRRTLRRNRRSRSTPCRQNRMNRARGCLPPSTKARWQWKLRIVSWLVRLFPVKSYVVEDVKAATKNGQSRWNKSFSPLEVGKSWFYGELRKFGDVALKQGWETKQLRDQLGLKKTSRKLAEVFEAHCVDSWVLANDSVGGHEKPDNTKLTRVVPLRFHRRMLHRMVPSKGGIRPPYGGTRSMDLKRGSLVKHPELGMTYIGGSSHSRLSLHSLKTGYRLTTSATKKDCRFYGYGSWRAYAL
jgi:hypothetical protein